MVDFHSHFLPNIDDGSCSVEESLQLLDMLYHQRVSTVIATPHFDANEQSIDHFLQRRQSAYTLVETQRKSGQPIVVLGAEVRYYPGISHLKELHSLCVENTHLLLLEMPTTYWTEYVIRELLDMVNSRGVTVVLAHIERYQQVRDVRLLHRLLDGGVLLQANASFFIDLWTRHYANKLLGNGMIHFLGSDCHNIRVRPPRLGAAFEIIERKFGQDFLCQMDMMANERVLTNVASDLFYRE